MADFVALGIQGADKLVDKHFHKIPDKYMRAETYDPRSRRSNNNNNINPPRSRGSSTHSNAETEDGRMIRMQDNERRTGNNDDGPMYYEDRRYPKTPYPYDAGPPPAMQRALVNPRAPPPLDDDDDRPRGRPRYDPESALAYPRASSFSPPPRYRSPDHRQQRRRPQDDSMKTYRHRERHRPSDAFSTSKKGIAGGALGAVVAGWATHAALEAQGKASLKEKRLDQAITVLGAVAGGLAANSMVDYLEDGRKDTSDEQRMWEARFGNRGRSRSRSRRRSGSRERGRGGGGGGYKDEWS